MPNSQSNFVLLGAGGMLGQAWRFVLEQADDGAADHLSAYDRAGCDITDEKALLRAVQSETDVVINCAAYTNVDGAEAEEAAATQINGDAVGILARRCREVGAKLVHYSTDYVFPGNASTPYPTDHPLEPINAYGRSKAVGERALAAAGCDYLLVRASWLYAPWGKNFVRTMHRLTAEKPELKVVNDQTGRPSSCEHLARTTLALIRENASGTYHVTDGGQCTWWELAREVQRLAGPEHQHCLIHPCTTTEYPTPSKRPAYSVLDLSKTEPMLGPMPDWKTNLLEVIRNL